MDTTTTTIGHGPVLIAAETTDDLCTTIATFAVLGPDDVLVVRFAGHLDPDRGIALADTIRSLGIRRVLVLDDRATVAITHRDPEP